MKPIGYLQAHGQPMAHYRDDGHWPEPVPVEPPTETQVALWREKWAATCSDKVARLLCALERDYSITGTATARSGAPAA